jgi:putative SOS response-associated peptidase YedK
MKDGKSFGIGGTWGNCKEPAIGEWIRTFAVNTSDAYALVVDIHDRMPLYHPRITHVGSETSPIRPM